MYSNILRWIAGGLFAIMTLFGGYMYSAMDARIRATEESVDALMESVSATRADVSYIRGMLEASRRREIIRDRE